jgi:hypothetical protein
LPFLLEDGTELLLEDGTEFLLENDMFASGGVLVAGTSVPIIILTTPGGGVVLGGSTNAYVVFLGAADGGVTAGGRAYRIDNVDVGSGGALLNGAAFHSFVKNQIGPPYLFDIGSTAYIVNNPAKKPFAGVVTSRRTLDANNFYKVASNWYMESNLLTYGQYQSYVKLDVKRLPKPGPTK